VRERKCERCYARSGLFVLIYCRPWPGPGGETRWNFWPRVACFDRAACEARREKRLERARTRGSMLVLAEPQHPDAPLGTCRWCGAELTGENGGRRNYCYLDREGRDCRGESWRSRTWDARVALVRRGDACCVDCGSDRGDWEADHEIPLEDGGEHSLDNLVRRCVDCHRKKTARENSERAARRRLAA
jgi:hypothetical protein